MTIRVMATAPGFLACLRVANDKFSIADEEAFASSWMVKLDKNDNPIKEEPKQEESAADARFVATHVAGGTWMVKDNSNGQRASKLFKKADGDAKALANVEAERLNAGGAIDVEAARPAPETPAKPPESGGGTPLPDA